MREFNTKACWLGYILRPEPEFDHTLRFGSQQLAAEGLDLLALGIEWGMELRHVTPETIAFAAVMVRQLSLSGCRSTDHQTADTLRP